ncbi:MAG: pyridoxamine 5'-phosphate oxidase family protein [Deltaproteobacteria bacterium]|nr:pyridoxamine 5'-phosphate oxidase family protein [Deltaproteobacteria bacterium]
MIQKMEQLLREKDICVLATASENRPHCSLMAYVTDDLCRKIYMVTVRESTKYRNLTRNPRVSLLMDTREEHSGPKRAGAQALTVSGRFQEIEDHTELDAVRLRLLNRHPHLRELVERQDAVIFAVKIASFLLLQGITNAHFHEV